MAYENNDINIYIYIYIYIYSSLKCKALGVRIE